MGCCSRLRGLQKSKFSLKPVFLVCLCPSFFGPQNTQREQMTFGFLPFGLHNEREAPNFGAEHSICHVAIPMILRFVIVFMCVLESWDRNHRLKGLTCVIDCTCNKCVIQFASARGARLSILRSRKDRMLGNSLREQKAPGSRSHPSQSIQSFFALQSTALKATILATFMQECQLLLGNEKIFQNDQSPENTFLQTSCAILFVASRRNEWLTAHVYTAASTKNLRMLRSKRIDFSSSAILLSQLCFVLATTNGINHRVI